MSTKRKKEREKRGACRSLITKDNREANVPPTWQLSTLQPAELLFKLKEEAEGKHGAQGTQEKYDDAQTGGFYKAAIVSVAGSRVFLDTFCSLAIFTLCFLGNVMTYAGTHLADLICSYLVCSTGASLGLCGTGYVFGWGELVRVSVFLFETNLLSVKILAVLLLAAKANQVSLWLCVGGEKSGDNWHHLLYNALYDKPIEEQEQWQKTQDSWIGIGKGGDELNFKMRERRRLRQAERLRRCCMPIPKTRVVYFMLVTAIVASMVYKVHGHWFSAEIVYLIEREGQLGVLAAVGLPVRSGG
jgi:hypothetical protein